MTKADIWSTIGHAPQKAWFAKIRQAGRLAHAYVLVGREHLGKTTFARDLAAQLGADPILDVFVLDGAEPILVGETRQLQNYLNLTPARAMKVAIIPGAERLTAAAGNSLLKILEEPPPHALLILTAANYHALLPTIASRLQRINFGPASDAEIRESLQGFSLSAAVRDAIVKYADGRIGWALHLAAAPAALGFYERAEARYAALTRGSIAQRLEAAQELAAAPEGEVEEFLKWAAAHWVAAGAPLLLGKKLLLTWRDLQFNLNPKLLMDDLFLPPA